MKCHIMWHLSYDVASGREITSCNKMDKVKSNDWLLVDTLRFILSLRLYSSFITSGPGVNSLRLGVCYLKCDYPRPDIYSIRAGILVSGSILIVLSGMSGPLMAWEEVLMSKSGVYGLWSGVCGIKVIVNDLRSDVCGIRLDAYDLRSDVCGIRLDAYDLRSDVCGIRLDAYDLRSDVCGIRLDAYDLRSDVCGISLDAYDLRSDVYRLGSYAYHPRSDQRSIFISWLWAHCREQ